ncbi:MAG: sugar ABC transporter permease [Lachnospiraceae bacterium]|nr:sugar ABC transporter permease [Lachnospiraceae bacterium]
MAETEKNRKTEQEISKKVRKGSTLLQRRNRKGYLFILPWLVGFVLFYVRSIFMTLQFSFNDLSMDAASGGYKLDWVGLQNFRDAFAAHPTFKQVLTTSVLDMVIDVPLIIFFSLFMAMLLNKEFPGRGLVRAIFFLPVLMNAGAITAALDLSAAMMNGGVSGQAAEAAQTTGDSVAFNVNYLIDMFVSFGIPEKLLDYMVTAVERINDIIRASGVQIIIFIAALQSIPSSLYEVAKIEGATTYETFWKVTFPMVMPHIITNVVYTIVDSYAVSDVVDLAYSTAFTNFNYGLSAVFSLVSSIVTCLILVLVVSFIQKRTFYYT